MRLFLFVFLCIAYPSLATTYYVSNTGNNSNSGTSIGSSFLTIQKGADVAIRGDSVIVVNGTYAGFDYRQKSGVFRDSVVFYASGSQVVINSSGPLRSDGINIEGTSGNELKAIEVNGFKVLNLGFVGNGIRLVYVDHCIVRNCTSSGNERGIFTGFTDNLLLEYNICTNALDEHGIYLSNSSDDALIRYNVSYDNNNIGIHMNGDLSQGEDGIIHRPVLYGNTIFENNMASGINMDGVDSAVIFNNLIYNNHNAQGIVMFKGDGAIMSKSALIYNNTIVVPSDGRWGILLQAGAENGTKIYNNIIHSYHSFRGVLGIDGTTNFTSDYNILQENRLGLDADNSTTSFANWKSQGLDQHSFLVTSHTDFVKLFVNNDTTNFHLAANSLARDTGTQLVSAWVTDDLDGNPRPSGIKYDLGAFEYQTALAVNDLQGFGGRQIGEQILLEWFHKVTDENASMILERSMDGIHFEKLGEVIQNGQARLMLFDPKPNPGTNYYRLRFNENDEIEYSKVIQVSFRPLATLIYPNPSEGILHFSKAGKKQLLVFFSDGRLVQKYDDVYQELHTLLEPGTYFIQIKTEESTHTEVLIVR